MVNKGVRKSGTCSGSFAAIEDSRMHVPRAIVTRNFPWTSNCYCRPPCALSISSGKVGISASMQDSKQWIRVSPAKTGWRRSFSSSWLFTLQRSCSLSPQFNVVEGDQVREDARHWCQLVALCFRRFVICLVEAGAALSAIILRQFVLGTGLKGL